MRAHGINPTVGKDLEGCAAEQGLQNIEVTVFENRTNAGDEGWDVIEFLLDVSGGMIGGELAKAGVESVNEMKARVAKAAKDPNNYFDNPAWVVLIANK